jgi:hypothetical protein
LTAAAGRLPPADTASSGAGGIGDGASSPAGDGAAAPRTILPMGNTSITVSMVMLVMMIATMMASANICRSPRHGVVQQQQQHGDDDGDDDDDDKRSPPSA